MRCSCAFFCSLLLLLPGAAVASDSDATQVVQPQAADVLASLHDYMSGVDTLQVKAVTTEEAVYGDSHKLQFGGTLTLGIRRPAQLFAVIHSDTENRRLNLNQETFTIFDEDVNVYAQADVPGTLDQVFSTLYSEFGLQLPGSELFGGNAYKLLVEDASEVVYVGKGQVNGVDCHHVAGSLASMDWQLWVRADGDPIVCKYLVTDRSLPLAPQYGMTFTEWLPGASISGEQFEFKAPADAEAIEFIQ